MIPPVPYEEYYSLGHSPSALHRADNGCDGAYASRQYPSGGRCAIPELSHRLVSERLPGRSICIDQASALQPGRSVVHDTRGA